MSKETLPEEKNRPRRVPSEIKVVAVVLASMSLLFWVYAKPNIQMSSSEITVAGLNCDIGILGIFPAFFLLRLSRIARKVCIVFAWYLLIGCASAFFFVFPMGFQTSHPTSPLIVETPKAVIQIAVVPVILMLVWVLRVLRSDKTRVLFGVESPD